MSDIYATTYSGSAAVTKSDTVADPAGPFAGLLMTAVGTLKVTLTDGQSIVGEWKSQAEWVHLRNPVIDIPVGSVKSIEPAE